MSYEQAPTRYDVERAIESSGLPACSRDVLYLLARRMDQGSILIPARFSPSLWRMADVSGWSKRHIQRHLSRLEREQVIVRTRVKGRRTAYAIVWPSLAALGTRSPASSAGTRDTVSPPLGTQGPRTRDTVSPELGTRGRRTRDTMARSQISQDVPDQEPDPEIKMIQRLILARTGREVGAEWAAQTRDTILAGTRDTIPAGQARTSYLRTAIARDPHPEKWLPTPQPPPFRGDIPT